MNESINCLIKIQNFAKYIRNIQIIVKTIKIFSSRLMRENKSQYKIYIRYYKIL